MRVLITFAGSNDPLAKTVVAGQEQKGPILLLVDHVPFDRVVILGTPDMSDRADQTKKQLKRSHSNVNTTIIPIEISDPTNHVELLRTLRGVVQDVLDDTPNADLSVAVTSGTPQMHACWLLLAASGEIPARLLQLRRPQYVSTAQPLVSELNLQQPGFPRVTPNICSFYAVSTQSADLSSICSKIGFVGEHPKFLKVIERAAKFAMSHLPVLIHGETGTGKEKLAELIHELSGRGGKRMDLNCAALSKDLVESELFGHVKGGFTGALDNKPGLMEIADKGTLFFDEIGEMPLSTQAKLLRVLDNGRVRRVGGLNEIHVNVRVIAATNRNLHEAVRKKEFREDLWHRLNGLELRLPSLRERRSDIPLLAIRFLEASSAPPGKQFSSDALKKLQRFPWPGNVRQLKSCIGRALVLSVKNVIGPDDIDFQEQEGQYDVLDWLPEPHEGFDYQVFVSQVKDRLRARALELANGNLTRAAASLRISASALSKFKDTQKPQR